VGWATKSRTILVVNSLIFMEGAYLTKMTTTTLYLIYPQYFECLAHYECGVHANLALLKSFKPKVHNFFLKKHML
jgi:hypothetical protein